MDERPANSWKEIGKLNQNESSFVCYNLAQPYQIAASIVFDGMQVSDLIGYWSACIRLYNYSCMYNQQNSRPYYRIIEK